MTSPTLGPTIRAARLARKIGLRSFAAMIEVSPSYVTDIEHDRRVPAEHRLEVIAFLLDLDPDTLRTLGGRWFGERERAYLASHPTAGRLVRRCAELGLEDGELRALIEAAEGLRCVMTGRKSGGKGRR